MRIVTILSKSDDCEQVIEFEILCCRSSENGSVNFGAAIGSLQGFILDIGYYPRSSDEGVFDVFDMRDGHAVNAFQMITSKRASLKRTLRDADFDMIGTFIHLERLWVDPKFRGNGLGLRLLREARHMLAKYGALVILKAHPDGENTPEEDCRKLARYYASDPVTEFRPVSTRTQPGWLVANWFEVMASIGDGPSWNVDPNRETCL